MKYILGILPLVFLLMSFSGTHDTETFSLTIKVADLKHSEGVVQFSLYNKKKTIPDEKYKKYYLQKTSKIEANSAEITFYDLPKGTYAINILHDEDEDGKIKKGWIFPIEGIGFSNFESIGFRNRPSFKKASFELTTDLVKKVKIIYM